VYWSNPREWSTNITASADASHSCSARASTGQCTINGLSADTYTVTLEQEDGGSLAASEPRSVTVPVKSE
jgi:hypothetical protein